MYNFKYYKDFKKVGAVSFDKVVAKDKNDRIEFYLAEFESTRTIVLICETWVDTITCTSMDSECECAISLMKRSFGFNESDIEQFLKVVGQ